MKFEEKHKEFAVKCFAQYMKRTDVVKAFMEEFLYDIAVACTKEYSEKIPINISRRYDERDNHRRNKQFLL